MLVEGGPAPAAAFKLHILHKLEFIWETKSSVNTRRGKNAAPMPTSTNVINSTMKNENSMSFPFFSAFRRNINSSAAKMKNRQKFQKMIATIREWEKVKKTPKWKHTLCFRAINFPPPDIQSQINKINSREIAGETNWIHISPASAKISVKNDFRTEIAWIFEECVYANASFSFVCSCLKSSNLIQTHLSVACFVAKKKKTSVDRRKGKLC